MEAVEKQRRLLVAGAAGFMGTNFLERVKNSASFEVIGVVHKRRPVVCGRNIEYVTADLRRMEECKRLFEKRDIDWVCMFAGELSPIAVLNNNPIGPVVDNTVIHAQMLEAAYLAGVRKFLWLSSSTGYPPLNGPLKEGDFFIADPASPYEPIGWMSRYIEKLSMLYATKPKQPMTVIALRPSAVFGEHDDFDFGTCHALPALIRRVVERKFPIEIWGTGEDERDWIYVDDLIDACLLALQKVEGYEVFNIGSGRTYNLNQLLRYILEIVGEKNTEIAYRSEKSRNISVRRLDCSLAKRFLGFEAKTPIEEGLAKTIRWYETQEGKIFDE